jgi:hypothetical protein
MKDIKRFEDPDSKCFIAYEREDNWRDFGYDKRYLDALGSVFLVNGNNNKVATVHRVKDKFFLSYNRNASKEDIKVLQNIVGFINNNNDKSLLIYHLAYNEIDFHGVISSYINRYTVADEIKQKAMFFIKTVQQFKKKSTNDINNITNQYFTLLTILSASNNLDLDPLKVEFSKIIIRPLQDVRKLLHYLHNNDNTPINYELVKLTHPLSSGNKPLNLHSDVNVVREFPCPQEGDYIGVSRLCCAPCHTVVSQHKYDHRGTHGIVFQDWKPPAIQFTHVMEELESKGEKNAEDTIASAEMDELESKDKKNAVVVLYLQAEDNNTKFLKTQLLKRLNEEQQRDLSDDEEIEIKIKIDDLECNLWELKQKLGIVGVSDYESSIEDQSIIEELENMNIQDSISAFLTEENIILKFLILDQACYRYTSHTLPNNCTKLIFCHLSHLDSENQILDYSGCSESQHDYQ